ncbi:MAG: TlpA disulfide reductase family protein [Planctomycetia bacterium]|nr:TlpA disulfide reductase family protein [Planctomycetia bacterium]
MLLSTKSVCFTGLAALLAGVLISCCLAWAAEDDKKPGEAAGKPDVPVLKTEPAGQPKGDPFAVPDGTPEQLLKFIESLQKMQPENRDKESVIAFLHKAAGAAVKAADKILAGTATKEQKTQAVGAKFGGLALLMRLRDKAAADAIERMPEELTKLGLPEVARDVHAALLQMQLRATVAGEPGAKTVDQVKDAIRAFVADKPDEASAGLVYLAFELFEKSEKTDQVLALCEEYGKVLAKSNDPDIGKLAKLFEGTVRRLKLVGSPMEVQGTMVDGKPFDWAKYKGKVVLVQFWATWCEPCMAELANVEEAYKLYRDRGFEVVGISIDDDRQALDEFLAKKTPPWTVLSDIKEGEGKSKHPTPEFYGVIGVPTMILIGQDGKVVSIDARGPRLAEGLEKLLGPAEKKPAEAKPETPEAKPAS